MRASLVSIYLLSIILLPSTHQSSNTLQEAVERASGVYLHPLPLDQTSPHTHTHIDDVINKTVVVTAFNYGYSNHLFNFKCFLERLDIKFLAVAMDEHAYASTVNISRNMITYLWMHPASYDDVLHPKVEESSTKFRSPQFNVMSMIKIESVFAIMKLGYNVIFIDPDVAVVRDPVPYMVHHGVDYVHTHNKICPQCYDWNFTTSEEEGNTGMYFVKSNPRTINLFDTVIKQSPR